MKKLLKYVVMATVAIAAFSGCSKDLIDNKVKEDEGVTKITCGIPEGTRTTVDGIKVKWEVGDVLYVSSKAGETVNFTIESADDIDPVTGKATFTSADCKIPEGTAIAACHFIQYSSARWENGCWYYDIKSPLSFKECLVGSPKRTVPVYAEGIMADNMDLQPQHLESMMRLKISNPSDEPMTLDKVIVSGKSLSGRYYVNPPSVTASKRVIFSPNPSLTISQGKSDEPFVVGPHSSQTLEFVVAGRVECPRLQIMVSVAEGSRRFDFTKTNFSSEVGTIHTFGLSLQTPAEPDHKIKIDGVEYPWFVTDPLPATPASSVVLLPGASSSLDANSLSALASALKSLKNVVVSVDLKACDWTSQTFDSSFQVPCLGDFWLPGNVTTTKGFGMFKGNTKMKWHLTKQLSSIDFIPFGNGGGTNIQEGCGFVLDYDPYEEGATYDLEDGTLYTKVNGAYTNVHFRIERWDDDVVGFRANTTSFDQFSLSNNNHVKEFVIPASVTKLGNSSIGYYCASLTKVTCKPVNPPTLGEKLSGSGFIIIDTGDDAQDLISAAAYYEAWQTKLGSWTIKTKSGVEMPLIASLNSLTSGAPYPNAW